MIHRFYKGNGALSVLIDDLEAMGPGEIRLAEVRLHLSAAGGAVGVATFTVKVDSGEGPEYSAILNGSSSAGVDMTLLADSRYAPDVPVPIRVKDHILIEYANGSNRTWGLEVIYKSAEA